MLMTYKCTFHSFNSVFIFWLYPSSSYKFQIRFLEKESGGKCVAGAVRGWVTVQSPAQPGPGSLLSSLVTSRVTSPQSTAGDNLTS